MTLRWIPSSCTLLCATCSLARAQGSSPICTRNTTNTISKFLKPVFLYTSWSTTTVTQCPTISQRHSSSLQDLGIFSNSLWSTLESNWEYCRESPAWSTASPPSKGTTKKTTRNDVYKSTRCGQDQSVMLCSAHVQLTELSIRLRALRTDLVVLGARDATGQMLAFLSHYIAEIIMTSRAGEWAHLQIC